MQDDKEEPQVVEIIDNDGGIIKKNKKDGRFVKGNKNRLGKTKTTYASITKMFNTASKATISNFSQRPMNELKAILADPGAKAMEKIAANLIVKAAEDPAWFGMLERTMRLPERLIVAQVDITDEQRNSEAYKQVFLIPSNGRESEENDSQ